MSIYDKYSIKQAYEEATKATKLLRASTGGSTAAEERDYRKIESNYNFLLRTGIEESKNYKEAVETAHKELRIEYLKYGYRHLSLEEHAELKDKRYAKHNTRNL